MSARAFARIVGFACRRPWLTIAIACLLSALSLVYITRNIAISSDATELISPGVTWRAAERRMDTAFPNNGDVTLVVIDGRTPELAESAAASLAAALATQTDHFRSVARPDGGPFFAREGLLFATPAEVRATTARLIEAQPFLGPLAADPSLRGIADTIATVAAGSKRDKALDSAMTRLADALDAQAAGRPTFFSWQAFLGSESGTLAAPTRRLLLVRPILDTGGLMPGEESSAAIRTAAARLQLDSAHGVTVRLTGSVPLSDEEFASLQDRWWLVAGAMLVAMLGTLFLATRSAKVTLAIMVSTVIGLLVTTGLGLAAVHRLNLISVAFVPLFVGLGVDFGIQLGVRFQAERHAGAAADAAMRSAAEHLGAPLLLAAGAVCLGFLAFLPTDYRGIAELGIIASLGMIVALAFSATLLPALLMLLRPGRPRAEVESASLAPLDAFLLRRRRLVLGLFGLSLAVSVALLPLVRFDFDPLHLRAADGEAVATVNDLMRDPDRTPNIVEILVPSLADAQRLETKLAALPEVGRVITAASFVPSEQAEKLGAIEDARMLLDLTLNPFDMAPPPSDADLVAALTSSARSLRGAKGAAAARLARSFDRLARGTPTDRAATAAILVPPLQTMLGQLRETIAAEPVDIGTLPQEIRREWLGSKGEAKVQVTPKAAFANGAGLTRFTDAIRAIAPDATGPAVSMQGAAQTISTAFIHAGIIALAIVTVLLLAALRDLREVIFTLAPVVLSGFLTLGTCVVIGQPINFANIIAFPLLFGIGVAFHIYFVMAWRTGATNLLQSSLARAIFFSAMATGTAFGSLWFSRHPGTASMGKVLMLSLIWTLVCALLFEPALLGPPRANARARH